METANMKVAVSSGCFLSNEIDEIVACSKSIGIETIELGPNVQHNGRKNVIETIHAHSDTDFLIHHYFPAPQTPFVCNIGHPATVERACTFIKKNIEMCNAIKIPYYSIHAGYGINPHPTQLGQNQSDLTPIPYDKSLELFVETAMELERFAREFKVKLLWENNVVSSTNQFNTQRTPYLFADIQFLKELENDDWWKNALILLDVGHLKVSAMSLNFSIEEFVERIAEKVVHVHLSDNDGLTDTNQPITSETFNPLNRLESFAKLNTLILEVYKITLSQISEQIDIINKIIN